LLSLTHTCQFHISSSRNGAGIVPGQFIVLLEPGAGHPAAVAALLLQDTAAALSDANSTHVGAASAATELQLVTLLGAAAKHQDASASGASSVEASSRSRGLSGLVVKASPAAVRRLRRSPAVAHVVPDLYASPQARIVQRHLAQKRSAQQQDDFSLPSSSSSSSSSSSDHTADDHDLVKNPETPSADNDAVPSDLPPVPPAAAAAAACTQPEALAAGMAVIGKPTSRNFNWPRCVSNRTQLVWIAKACGSPPARRNADNNNSSSSVQYVELRAVVRASGKLFRVAGTRDACVLTPDAARPGWSRNMFGGCGSAPGFAANLPTRVRLCGSSNSSSPNPNGGRDAPATPNDGSLRLPRVPVAGDTVPTSITQIEAVTNAGVSDSAAAAAAGSGRGIVAAVMDSGIDASHWDIEYAGGKSFLADDEDPGTDDLGHGECHNMLQNLMVQVAVDGW
jgi:hypothetical protein